MLLSIIHWYINYNDEINTTSLIIFNNNSFNNNINIKSFYKYKYAGKNNIINMIK